MGEDGSEDRRVVQCNYATGISAVTTGARAYLARTNPGGGNDRIVILARSRGGRWIEKWEDIRRLENFRPKTLPPGHPLSGDPRIWDDRHAQAGGAADAGGMAECLQSTRLRATRPA